MTAADGGSEEAALSSFAAAVAESSASDEGVESFLFFPRPRSLLEPSRLEKKAFPCFFRALEIVLRWWQTHSPLGP